MNRLGTLLMWIGAATGTGVAVLIFIGAGAPGASWLVNVGLAKLALVAAGGLIGGGAVVSRLGQRRDARKLELESDRQLPSSRRSVLNVHIPKVSRDVLIVERRSRSSPCSSAAELRCSLVPGSVSTLLG